MARLKTAGLFALLTICARDPSPVGNDYRDLNKNARLDVYEDPTQSVEKRGYGLRYR